MTAREQAYGRPVSAIKAAIRPDTREATSSLMPADRYGVCKPAAQRLRPAFVFACAVLLWEPGSSYGSSAYGNRASPVQTGEIRSFFGGHNSEKSYGTTRPEEQLQGAQSAQRALPRRVTPVARPPWWPSPLKKIGKLRFFQS